MTAASRLTWNHQVRIAFTHRHIHGYLATFFFVRPFNRWLAHTIDEFVFVLSIAIAILIPLCVFVFAHRRTFSDRCEISWKDTVIAYSHHAAALMLVPLCRSFVYLSSCQNLFAACLYPAIIIDYISAVRARLWCVCIWLWRWWWWW